MFVGDVWRRSSRWIDRYVRHFTGRVCVYLRHRAKADVLGAVGWGSAWDGCMIKDVRVTRCVHGDPSLRMRLISGMSYQVYEYTVISVKQLGSCCEPVAAVPR
jgi:hypothetical protein